MIRHADYGIKSLFLTIQVSGDRSKWMCEAIFGPTIVDYMYPCHICYSIFSVEEELREHFRYIFYHYEICVISVYIF